MRPRRALALGAAAVVLAVVAGCEAPGAEPGPSPDEPAAASAAKTGTASEATASAPPLTGLTLAVDPGHNGGNAADPAALGEQVPDGRDGTKDCNTVGTESDDGYPEHRFAWELAQALVAQVEEAGGEAVLSRDSDDGVGPCVDERGKFAGEADADALISLHANGTEDRSAAGFHVITGAAGAAADDEAVRASREIAEALVAELENEGLERNPAYDEVVERADLATLSNASVPAVMLEAGEMRSAADAELLASEEGQERIARAIVAALGRALG